MSRANIIFFTHCCPLSRDAGLAHTLYQVLVWWRQWRMETEWWAEDFDSPIVLCLANIKQRRKIYAVAQSSFAVNSRSSWPGLQVTSSWSRDAGFYFNDNGEWRLMKWTNGDQHWPDHQESRMQVCASGYPSSRLGDQGQWSIVWVYRQWKLDHGQWTLRII